LQEPHLSFETLKCPVAALARGVLVRAEILGQLLV
jgi:hypothetical protein